MTMNHATNRHLILLVTLMASLHRIAATVTSTTEYPYADDYFDRIYKVEDGGTIRYLHIYCKDENMVSISITNSIEYEEYPRFPVYPEWAQCPKFQRRSYTAFEFCHVEAEVNRKNVFLELRRIGEDTPFFSLNQFSFKQVDHIQIATSDDSKKWGMGERFQKHFAIKDGTWTVWNRDRPWEIDVGSKTRSSQTYGHQPVYLARENSGSQGYHMVYLKNTYGFNFDATKNAKDIKYSLTGGHIHFIILHGRNPEKLLQKYHHFIGPAHVPPFWSLGYHQSRWGYKNFYQFSKVVEEFDKLSLPLDTMWSDLDYMKSKAIFTVDESSYPPAKMRTLLESKNIHYVPLIDVGVSVLDKVATNAGMQAGVFFKSVKNVNDHYLATVWPGKVHFVDYLHPNASSYWQSQLDRLYRLIPFSGVWLDMNEPSNFQGNQHTQESFQIQRGESINMMTIDVNLNHYTPAHSNLKHKEVHAYYGHLSTVPTHSFLKKHGRPFIISRSNSVGTGAYAGHWTGDNVANWQFLRLSISGNFLFQIFGIQMVGADICGFHQNTNEQLCSRWMQVGSFYPFARNHNENESISQEPYRYGSDLMEATRMSFNQRYSLLKQMYTSMVILNGSGSFYRPMFFEFYKDQTALGDEQSQTQFMIGDYLMGAPIVSPGATNRRVYFPGEDNWYELKYALGNGFTHSERLKMFKGGQSANIENLLSMAPPTFLRAGKILLSTAPKTRAKYLDSNFTAYIALKDGQAVGHILGISDYSNETQISGCLKSGCTMQFKVVKKDDKTCEFSWEYKGFFPYRADLAFSYIRVFEESRQWVTHASAIKISKPQGTQTFQITEI